MKKIEAIVQPFKMDDGAELYITTAIDADRSGKAFPEGLTPDQVFPTIGTMPQDSKDPVVLAVEFELIKDKPEAIVKRLEEGKVPLEESVAIYERGEALKRRCEHLLHQAEARVEKIALDASGKPKGTEPLDVK